MINNTNTDITQRWKEIGNRLHKQQEASPLAQSPVTLIAVSKAQPAAAIEALLVAGQHDFGENRVQEAASKWPPLLNAYPKARLHLIGSLQTNKVKEALSLFDVIHTVDREALVDAIIKDRGKSSVRTTQFFVQVNTGEESQKGGVLPKELPKLLAYCALQGLAIDGLMCVPPLGDLPAPHFALLHTMARDAGLSSLSMGMSGDFELAVKLGATHVRIGTALFGERPPTP